MIAQLVSQTMHKHKLRLKKSLSYAETGFFISENQGDYFDYSGTAPVFFGIIPDFYFFSSEKSTQSIIKMQTTSISKIRKVICMEKNTPEKKFKAGAVSATVWKNQSKEGNEFSSVSFEKVYKDQNDEWKSTGHLNVNDLPKALVVIGKAFEHLALKEA